MITLPHRCEFLSDGWLDEARKFLERECKHRKEQLAGRPFSLSERFTDAPPHLKLPDNVAAWNFRYDGENVSVSRGFNDAADLKVEGDYQAVLDGGAVRRRARSRRDGRDGTRGRDDVRQERVAEHRRHQRTGSQRSSHAAA